MRIFILAKEMKPAGNHKHSLPSFRVATSNYLILRNHMHDHDSSHSLLVLLFSSSISVAFSFLLFLFQPSPFQLFSVSNPFLLTSFVSWDKTTVDCIHIDLVRYVTASYPLGR